jgi:putative ABC transport system ATP-binding protein
VSLIEVRNLKKIYVMGEELVAALAGVNLSVARGDFVAVIGPSGSGKSSLMNIIGGLDRPTEGDYFFNGEDISTFDDTELALFRNKSIGFIFQSFQLLPRLSAAQNVELPMIYGGLPPHERREQALELLNKVGLADRADHKPAQMSGGQQQRVAIARALANKPDLLLADEPTGALDSKTGKEVLKLFQDLNDEGLTVIIVTHDLGVAARAKRRITFKDGLIISDERGEVQSQQVEALIHAAS